MLFQTDPNRYYYLASPYTHPDPRIREWRAHQAMAAAAKLAADRIWVYSPIAHNHEMCIRHELPFTFEWWDVWNKVMIRASAGIIVLTLPGWDRSVGVEAELRFALELKLPIQYYGWLHPEPTFPEPAEGQ